MERYRYSKGYRVFQTVNMAVMIAIIFLTLYPFIYLLSVSLSSSTEVLKGDVFLYPRGLTLDAYGLIVKQPVFWTGYANTILYTVTGTVLGLFMTTICAYPLAQRGLPGRRGLIRFMVFTMYFTGGLIPNFILVRSLHMMDTIWAIILPGVISVYNMLVMRTFFEGIPESLQEAARIDGLDQIGVLTRIVLPLSKPIMAAMVLFIAVVHWNDWFNALIYLNTASHYPVTIFLRNMVMAGADTSQQIAQGGQGGTDAIIMPQTMQAATIMLITIPILCVYPFVQKYFVKGVMIGAVKE